MVDTLSILSQEEKLSWLIRKYERKIHEVELLQTPPEIKNEEIIQLNRTCNPHQYPL